MNTPELTAEERAYFAWEHENSHAATKVEVVGPYRLHVTFDDGTDSTIDFEHALKTFYHSGMYAPLIDPDYFAQVEVKYHGVLTWPNGIDFHPAYIYRWDKHLAMIEDAGDAQ